MNFQKNKRIKKNKIDCSIMYSGYSNEYKQNSKIEKERKPKVPKENTKTGNPIRYPFWSKIFFFFEPQVM